ncbi:MAG TPA: IS481 family transposase [Longimicrobiaceae bacterium]|jgi:transposase InsO family protein|nr:IS481 family transposase [Longimicrobiaceae bacterium]
MDERMRFVVTHAQGLYSMTELCQRFGISRPCGYKWLERCAAEGPHGLADRSHRPHRCPHKIDGEVAETILGLRRKHPTWGPITLLAYLAKHSPGLELPAPSTVGDLLAREGLVQPRHRRAKPGRSEGGTLHTSEPNEVWTADYKGQFRTRDGKYCYPLTIQDAYSRFLLLCEALLSTRGEEAKPCFERMFREYGLPRAIRTDNGSPFASPTPLRLSQLNVWWIELGITPNRSRPRCPQDNGSHERMHEKLTPTRFPPAQNQQGQQVKFDDVREELDYVRPHHALGLKTPSELYVPSPRPMPERIPEPEYPGHCEVRRVRGVGTVRFRGREIFISEVLARKTVALEETAEGMWSVFFYHVKLGRFDERLGKLFP